MTSHLFCRGKEILLNAVVLSAVDQLDDEPSSLTTITDKGITYSNNTVCSKATFFSAQKTQMNNIMID